MRCLLLPFVKALTLSIVVCWCSSLNGQTSAVNQTEYIESSSPLPGGGVVSSVVYFNDAGNPVSGSALAPQNSPATENSLLTQRPVTQGSPNATLGTSAPTGQWNTATTGYPPQGVSVANTQQPVVAPQVTYSPSLGVPTTWQVAMRPGCQSCGTPPASLPPTLPTYSPNQGTVAGFPPAGRQVYQPLIALQNMPPSVYPGQGIFGSPKLYVDGQPIRNLLRYLIVP